MLRYQRTGDPTEAIATGLFEEPTDITILQKVNQFQKAREKTPFAEKYGWEWDEATHHWRAPEKETHSSDDLTHDHYEEALKLLHDRAVELYQEDQLSGRALNYMRLADHRLIGR